MSFPYFISPEQAMRERSELARKGIARGRSVVALVFSGGVLFVAENPSRSLQKISELYDRVGFAAAGKFNEFDNLRRGGIQFADTRGYAYDRRDVTGRQLANVYAQTLGTIFTEQAKPYEVELCVAEVAHYGETKAPELYRITYDGSINDEPHFVVMGGTTEPITTALKDSYAENADLTDVASPLWKCRHWRSPSSTSTGRGEHSGGSPVPRWSGCCLNTTTPNRRPTTRPRNRRNRL
jgi:proteasome alpha subunit